MIDVLLIIHKYHNNELRMTSNLDIVNQFENLNLLIDGSGALLKQIKTCIVLFYYRPALPNLFDKFHYFYNNLSIHNDFMVESFSES